MRHILLALILVIILTGCSLTSPSTWFSWLGLGSNNTGTANDFVMDNDAVFDLFQDDFGTGTQYDDRFVTSGDGDLNVGDTSISADGQVDYGPEPNLTFDPAYNRIGEMTPTELHEANEVEIPVLVLGNNLFPFPDKQFGDKKPIDKCDYTHYHGSNGYTLDRHNIAQPEDPCGFGDATKIISVAGDEMIEWFHNRPRNF